MPSYSLRMTVPTVIPKTRARTTFYWTPSGPGSFVRSFGPRLGSLGPVAEPNIEFARLAAAVYAADRSTPRAGNGSNWSQREFELTVPVWQPSRWEPVADRLGQLLGFLSGDAWRLTFVTARTPKEPIADTSRDPAGPRLAAQRRRRLGRRSPRLTPPTRRRTARACVALRSHLPSVGAEGDRRGDRRSAPRPPIKSTT